MMTEHYKESVVGCKTVCKIDASQITRFDLSDAWLSAIHTLVSDVS